MTQRKAIFISVPCTLLTALVQPIFANSAGTGLMEGYVKDGLHSEAHMNFASAISSYKKAISGHPEDRYAWLRLAKVYRARDQYGEALVQHYEIQQREREIEKRLSYKHPAVACRYRFYQDDYAKSGLGRYCWEADSGLFGFSREGNRILLVDTNIYVKIGPQPGYLRVKESFDAELKELAAANQRKEKAWQTLEASRSDSAAMWLALGLACEKCRAEEGEAALRIVLLSNPDKSQAEQANLAITRMFAIDPRTYNNIIAPEEHQRLDDR